MQIPTYEKMAVNTQVTAPEGYVLVLKADLVELEESVGRGEWKDLKWFKEKVGVKNEEKLNKLVFRPFKEELDVDNGGFVHYPVASGDPWMFHKIKTEKWLDENFDRVFRNWSVIVKSGGKK